MNELSIIKETVEVVKLDGQDKGNQSEDSGLASSNNSSAYSGRDEVSFKRCLIIPFQALNPATPKESTMLMNKSSMKNACDESSIAPAQSKDTVISCDGKT